MERPTAAFSVRAIIPAVFFQGDFPIRHSVYDDVVGNRCSDDAHGRLGTFAALACVLLGVAQQLGREPAVDLLLGRIDGAQSLF
jgi:hypothetical protein